MWGYNKINEVDFSHGEGNSSSSRRRFQKNIPIIILQQIRSPSSNQPLTQKIKQFEQEVIHSARPTPPLARRQSTPQLTHTPTPAVKLNKHDEPKEVIEKNKEETKRMEGFVKELNSKLKNGAVKAESKIRSPLTGFAPIPDGVFDRLKLLEDAQYEA